MIKEVTIQGRGNTMKEWTDELCGPIGPLGSFRESIADKYNHIDPGDGG